MFFSSTQFGQWSPRGAPANPATPANTHRSTLPLITDDDDDDNDDDNDEDDGARSDWMGLSGGDQSERINSSHSIFEEFARSDWMGLSGGEFSHLLKYNFST